MANRKAPMRRLIQKLGLHKYQNSGPLRPELCVDGRRASLDRGGEFGHRLGGVGANVQPGFDGKADTAFARAFGTCLIEPVVGVGPAAGGDGGGKSGE